MDDEAAVRQMTKTTLENYGYQVVTAICGLTGITTFVEHRKEIQLLVSDTDMPIMSGLAALNVIRKMSPEIPIIIASGSKHDSASYQRIDATHLTVLDKPYTIEQLLRTVAKALNSVVL